jgi:hypothetical protein
LPVGETSPVDESLVALGGRGEIIGEQTLEGDQCGLKHLMSDHRERRFTAEFQLEDIGYDGLKIVYSTEVQVQTEAYALFRLL